MNTIENIKAKFESLHSNNGEGKLSGMEKNAFSEFNRLGIPTARHEEWKYTRIGGLFNKSYEFSKGESDEISSKEIEAFQLPGHQDANEMIFINGVYSAKLSNIRSNELVILSLADATKGEYAEIISTHLGCSNNYVKDGIQALNSSFLSQGVFIHVQKGRVTPHPIYIYHITDARTVNRFSQPRSLVHISENAQVTIVDSFFTIGSGESFTNQVMEVVVEKDALVEYYKIQNDHPHSNQVSTTHFRQVGKSFIHTVTISLNGDIVRNNLSIAMEAEHAESLLYGLYFLKGDTHVDNHTVVDNVKPNCLSNQLYKGILDVRSTGVFNGKIFVQRDAQKTNAFQSNKNILLSDNASVNTKPQLEIFADDVKCSHGCTVGRLNEEGLFYLRSRGISEKVARSLLVNAFAVDILEHIKLEPIRRYVDSLLAERLEFNLL